MRIRFSLNPKVKPTVALLALFLLSDSVSAVDIPEQGQVFTIAAFSRPSETCVSPAYIFSALPFYRKLPPGETPPWSKYDNTEQGAIVLNDKTVLLFNTQSAMYISLIDATNHSAGYKLTRAPHRRTRSPHFDLSRGNLRFPRPEDVFCVAVYPWNKAKYFTQETLTDALPRLKPLSQSDPPERVTMLSTGIPGRPLVAYPTEWVEAGHNGEPLNGVLVLKNRAVLKWIAWSPNGIAFQNHWRDTYFWLSE